MSSKSTPVLPFHDSVSAWFSEQFGTPTEVQAASWPHIAAREHLLITAPTGSGKTLTAFTWSLSEFAAGHYNAGRTKVLYISPLKALNNDIQRNLLTPIAQLRGGYGFPELRVLTRSGDTSQGDRQRMLRNPPDILITTPESLGLMLTTRRGRLALSDIDTVILDEIHSIVDNRRGAQLMVNLERLADLAGDFQRIALSATVAPLESVADYVAGTSSTGEPRPVQIINTPGNKQIDFRVKFPEPARNAAQNGQKIWEPLAESFRETIGANQATLLFTNSRRLAEKITLQINDQRPEPLAYAHHGSLARDVRTEVERRLKAGELKAIVATNSLEMGIDVGALDEVILVQSPPSVAATLQRIGRSGHRVGQVSTGTLFPSHANDFLEAAVLGDAVDRRDIEPQRLMRAPLDVLAQIIISICSTDPWPIDDVYELIIRAAPYRALSRENFNLVVEMLSGRYAGSRVRELKARLQHDRINQTIQATRGALLAMYSSGGTIPDRGYFQMRHVDTGAVLGELDEEFVWEATIGQTFTLGTQNWQIQRITHNDVIVRQARPDAYATPFWRAEAQHRSYHFSSLITEYLERIDGQLASGAGAAVRATLTEHSRFDSSAAEELVDYLTRQRAHTAAALPHRHHLLLELVRTGPAGYKGPDDPRQLVIHTYWGGRLNQPFALALQAAWSDEFGGKAETHADNNAIVIQCQADPDPHAVMNLVKPENLTLLLRKSLEGSGFFGARFRECAGRALLLNRQRFNQRLPLWMSRMQAKKLMGQMKKYSEFPVMLETWRTCLDDEFDIPELLARLHEIRAGAIDWSFVTTPTPSPFAHNLTFGQVSRYMYADDTPQDDELSALSEDLIAHALHNDALRPTIDQAVVERFEAKRQRRESGYEPLTANDWEEWLKERVLIPEGELPDRPELPKQACWIEVDTRRWLTHLELVANLHHTGLLPNAPPTTAPPVKDERDATQYGREILSYYGPLTEGAIAELLPTVPTGLLTVGEDFIHGRLISDSGEDYWCDAENFEILMRFQRADRRANIQPAPAADLPLLWASLQRTGQPHDETNMTNALELLRGYPAPVQAWLKDLLPARLRDFQDHDWANAFNHHGFNWLGAGLQRLTVCYTEETDLFASTDEPAGFAEHFADPHARYSFAQIADASGLGGKGLNDAWWHSVWNGQITADTLLPVKQGSERDYQFPDALRASSGRRRQPRGTLGWPGHWQLIHTRAPEDALSLLEADKERVRMLLDRYGLINRDIVRREGLSAGPGRGIWRWRDAFRALRVMELAGEVSSGLFFDGLSTPQFISPRALSMLQGNIPKAQNFWISAYDPASPCGLALDWPELPNRRQGNYLSFFDGKLALTIESRAKHLMYHVPWDHPEIDSINEVLQHLGPGQQQRLTITTINGADARSSPYRAALQRRFSIVTDHKSMYLEANY